jgi:hypothetical protein
MFVNEERTKVTKKSKSVCFMLHHSLNGTRHHTQKNDTWKNDTQQKKCAVVHCLFFCGLYYKHILTIVSDDRK